MDLERVATLYERMVDEGVDEILQSASGGTVQRANLPKIRELVRADTEAALILLPELQRLWDERGLDVGFLHGTWLAMAYLQEFGQRSLDRHIELQIVREAKEQLATGKQEQEPREPELLELLGIADARARARMSHDCAI